jgi:hypothetical protein
MDAFAQLARAADQIRHSIDLGRFAESVTGLRRDLDLAFARVLDREDDPEQRTQFIDGYCALSLSLDELERLHAA